MYGSGALLVTVLRLSSCIRSLCFTWAWCGSSHPSWGMAPWSCAWLNCSQGFVPVLTEMTMEYNLAGAPLL